MSITRGIIVAGGIGSRLYPLTTTLSKQLLPVYSVPMIYYPLATLMRHGIRDILLLVRPGQQGLFRAILQDGRQWGISIEYAEQAAAKGIPDAVIIGEQFINKDPFLLVLGDNVMWQEPSDMLVSTSPAKAFTVKVNNPSSFGIAKFAADGSLVDLVEKPVQGNDRDAVIGFYLLDRHATEFAKQLLPSARGELEIVELLKKYMERGNLTIQRFEKQVRWFDCGSPAGMLEASSAVELFERTSETKIACPEEIALHSGLITRTQYLKLMEGMPKTEYREYLKTVLTRRG